MNKIVKKIMKIIASFVIIFTLVGCDKETPIKRKYHQNNYQVTTYQVDETYKTESSYGVIEIISVVKGNESSAIIWVFDSKKAIKKAFTEELFDRYDKENYINNNCLYRSSKTDKAYDIFVNA